MAPAIAKEKRRDRRKVKCVHCDQVMNADQIKAHNFSFHPNKPRGFLEIQVPKTETTNIFQVLSHIYL